MEAPRWLNTALLAVSSVAVCGGALQLSCSGDRPPLIGELDASADGAATVRAGQPPSFVPGTGDGEQDPDDDQLGAGIPESQEPSGSGNVPIGEGNVPMGDDPILPGESGSGQPILPGGTGDSQPTLPGGTSDDQPTLPGELPEPIPAPPGEGGDDTTRDDDGSGEPGPDGDFTFPGGRFNPGTGEIVFPPLRPEDGGAPDAEAPDGSALERP